MPVYVDKITAYPKSMVKGEAARYGVQWSHLWADTEEELHELAQKIGMSRSWWQKPHHKWDVSGHYDVVPSRRVRALEAGAISRSYQDYITERLFPEEVTSE